MFCNQCGQQLEDGAKFCGGCGAPAPVLQQDPPKPQREMMMQEDPSVVSLTEDEFPPSHERHQPQKTFPVIRVLLGVLFLLIMIGGCIGLMADFNDPNSMSVGDSIFTVRRIIFGTLSLVGLLGATAAFIAVVMAKKTALTVCAVILYLLTCIGCIGGVGYFAVQNDIFSDAEKTAAATSDEAEKTTSGDNIIPACAGMTLDDAQKQLQSMGCIVRTDYQYSESVPKDRVISQSVEEGTKVKNAMIIELTVSKGAEKATEKATEKPTEEPTEQAPEGYEQKLTVVAEKGASSATATLYEWKNGKWEKLAVYDAAVGSNGIGAASEGSSTTPQGMHKLGVVLSSNSISTNLNTYRVTKNTVVVDDSSSDLYNQIMEKSGVPKGVHYDDIGKGLTDGTTYATIFIEHNGDGFSSDGVVKKAGSAIGVRGQNGALEANYGDVDISADDMKDLLSKLDANKHPMIEIKTK